MLFPRMIDKGDYKRIWYKGQRAGRTSLLLSLIMAGEITPEKALGYLKATAPYDSYNQESKSFKELLRRLDARDVERWKNEKKKEIDNENRT